MQACLTGSYTALCFYSFEEPLIADRDLLVLGSVQTVSRKGGPSPLQINSDLLQANPGKSKRCW